MDAASSKNLFPEFNLDPALAETVETVPAEQLIEGIIRLEDPSKIPPDFKVVTRFNRICTGRFPADHTWAIRQNPYVLSLKGAREVGISNDDEDLTALRRFEHAQAPSGFLTPFKGRGCIVAALDFGLDFAHPNFLNPDGTTRLVSFWHQGANYDAAHPNRYGYGRVFSREEINAALRYPNPYRSLGYHPAISDTGDGSHGSKTLDIAAGNGRARGARAAPAADADLIFIHLSTPRVGVVGDLGDSVRLLEALDHVERTARGRPWVANLSIGRTAGSHDGTSLVEQGMHELLRMGPDRAIVQSAGNYGSANLAAVGWCREGEIRDLEWIVDPADTTDNEIDLWYSGKDRFVIAIRPPQGTAFVEAKLGDVADIVHEGAVVGRLYHRKDDPNNRDNHAEVYMYPGAPSGVWTLRLIGEYVISGRFHAWIERDVARPGAQSRFDGKITSPSYTLGTIATSPLAITVGAYDSGADGTPLAPFSSCGPTRDGRYNKPEILAPGVRVVAARSIPRDARRQEGLLAAGSGTSFAAPLVTGTVAAMFEAAGRPVSVHEIRACLKRSAEPAMDGEQGGCCGWGRLNVAGAIREIRGSMAAEPASRGNILTIDRIYDTDAESFAGTAHIQAPSGDLINNYGISRSVDQAEEALPDASSKRRESEMSFLQELLRGLDDRIFTAGPSPAELFRAVLDNTPLMQKAREVLEVVALPSRRPEGALRPGDWILRAVPGTGDVGHVSVLASADLLTPPELEFEGIAAESRQPGQYGLVVEAGAYPHSRSQPFARRVLDSSGCVLLHTVILRPLYPRAGALADLPPDEPEGTQRAVYIQSPDELPEFDAEVTAPEEEGTTPELSVLVVDERVQPLIDCDYAIYQGDRSERGRYAKGGKGLVTFKSIDPTQPFIFEVRDRVCAIYSGAFIDPDDPAIEYGGTWFDWALVRDNKKDVGTSFWPHYRRARERALYGEGSPRSVDSFWQHEHIVRRPIRAIASAGGYQQVTIQAVPAQIRTGPLVRYTDQQRACIWLEPTTPSMVKLRIKRAGGREPEKTAYGSTVRVGGRYFAIVEIDGLHPDTFYQYTLDVAPLPAKGAIPVDSGDFGPAIFPEITPNVRQAMRQQLSKASVEQTEWLTFRTLRATYDNSLRFVTGSCRWYPGDVISSEDSEPKDWAPDMLDKLGEWLRRTPRARWPHFQFYGGDQIYADEIGDGHHAELIRGRFASRVPGPQDPSASVAERLIDGAWAGRFAHRFKELPEVTGPSGDVSNNVTSGLKELTALYKRHPVLRLIAKRLVTEKQLHEQYETRLTRRRDVQGAKSEAGDEREAREAINSLPRLKQLLIIAEPYRVYVPYWNWRQLNGAANPKAYKYRLCNFLLWDLPVFEKDLPTLQDQTAGDRGVRAEEDRGHPSANDGKHVADFAEYAFLYERAWTTSPNVRTLLANVPTFLMLDDHEVTDDWNFDVEWVRMVHSRRDQYRMWPKTITDALCAYWVYQGQGNQARSHWRRDRDPRADVLDRAQRAGIDALPELRKCIYGAVMADSPVDGKATFQTGTSLKWHYELPFQPPFLVPDCRTRKRLVPGDDTMKQIDHERNPPQSETIDAEQLKWLSDRLTACKTPVAFIAPSTPLLMQKAVLKIMTQPESYAKAWLRDKEGDTFIGLAVAVLTGISTMGLIRTFRRAKDLEHMIRDKSWRDIWGLVETMNRNRSPVKTLVLVSGDVHHSYCMTGNLSGRGRPFPEILQITSSGLQTTIRRGTQEAIGEGLSDLSFNFAQRHLVPGFMTKEGSRRRELALYRNAAAIVDVTLEAEVDVRVTHLASDEKNKDVDRYVYQYTSGPSYMKMGEPANTPYRLGDAAEVAEDVSEGVAEPRVVIDEASLDWPEDQLISSEDSLLYEDAIGFTFDLQASDPQVGASTDFLSYEPYSDLPESPFQLALEGVAEGSQLALVPTDNETEPGEECVDNSPEIAEQIFTLPADLPALPNDAVLRAQLQAMGTTEARALDAAFAAFGDPVKFTNRLLPALNAAFKPLGGGPYEKYKVYVARLGAEAFLWNISIEPDARYADFVDHPDRLNLAFTPAERRSFLYFAVRRLHEISPIVVKMATHRRQMNRATALFRHFHSELKDGLAQFDQPSLLGFRALTVQIIWRHYQALLDHVLEAVAKGTMNWPMVSKDWDADLRTAAITAQVDDAEATVPAFRLTSSLYRDYFNASAASDIGYEHFTAKPIPFKGHGPDIPFRILFRRRVEQRGFIEWLRNEPSADALPKLHDTASWQMWVSRAWNLPMLRRETKLEAILGYVAGYFEAFTVHVPHDLAEGCSTRNYLTRIFPRAVTGSLAHDCFVYAVRWLHILGRLISPGSPSGITNQRIFLVEMPAHVGVMIRADMELNRHVVISLNNKHANIHEGKASEPDEKAVEFVVQDMYRGMRTPFVLRRITSTPANGSELWNEVCKLADMKLVLPYKDTSFPPHLRYLQHNALVARIVREHSDAVRTSWSKLQQNLEAAKDRSGGLPPARMREEIQRHAANSEKARVVAIARLDTERTQLIEEIDIDVTTNEQRILKGKGVRIIETDSSLPFVSQAMKYQITLQEAVRSGNLSGLDPAFYFPEDDFVAAVE